MLSCFPERATEDDVEVGFFGKVDGVHRLGLSNFDWPVTEAIEVGESELVIGKNKAQ